MILWEFIYNQVVVINNIFIKKYVDFCFREYIRINKDVGDKYLFLINSILILMRLDDCKFDTDAYKYDMDPKKYNMNKDFIFDAWEFFMGGILTIIFIEEVRE